MIEEAVFFHKWNHLLHFFVKTRYLKLAILDLACFGCKMGFPSPLGKRRKR